jgi:hypothetical protein
MPIAINYDTLNEKEFINTLEVIDNIITSAMFDSIQGNKRIADIRYDCIIAVRNHILMYLSKSNSQDNSDTNH